MNTSRESAIERNINLIRISGLAAVVMILVLGAWFLSSGSTEVGLALVLFAVVEAYVMIIFLPRHLRRRLQQRDRPPEDH